jgi:D-beta-D-heptose 7-phosphate kinase / D-beta-D-heptose 1-phosphate adenosyltransferase
VTDEIFYPGGAGNAAACMAAIGLDPLLISIVGKEGRIDYASILKEVCSALGTKTMFYEDESRKTTLKMRLAAVKTTKQHIARVDREDNHPLNEKSEKNLIRMFEKKFFELKPEIVSLHDYKKGFFSRKVFRVVVKTAENEDIPIFADLKQDTFVNFSDLIKKPEIFYLKPNRVESVATAKLINGFNKDGRTEEEILEIAKIIQKKVPVHVIITRGQQGAVYCGMNRSSPYFVKPREVEEQFDVAGAGDTVEAFLIASHLGGATMSEALEIAVAASQVAIRKFGTSIVTLDELLTWIKKSHNKRA